MCKLYFVFQASFKYKDYFLQPMMNYVLDRNADVRQVCLILAFSYRGISHCVLSRPLPYDVKWFCFTGCVLRMWSDGAVWRRGIRHSLHRSVGGWEFLWWAGNWSKNVLPSSIQIGLLKTWNWISRFHKTDLEMERKRGKWVILKFEFQC